MAKRITAPAKEPVDGNLPDAKKLAAHVAAYGALDSKSAELRGQIGALVKAGELDHNIHRAASKLAMKLAKMDDSKRGEFMRHFDHYRDLLKLDAQTDLFDGKTPEVPASQSVGKSPARNGAAKPKAEKAVKVAKTPVEKKQRVARKKAPVASDTLADAIADTFANAAEPPAFN